MVEGIAGSVGLLFFGLGWAFLLFAFSTALPSPSPRTTNHCPEEKRLLLILGPRREKSSNCAHTVGIHNALLILILASATTSAKKPACCIHSILAGLIQET